MFHLVSFGELRELNI